MEKENLKLGIIMFLLLIAMLVICFLQALCYTSLMFLVYLSLNDLKLTEEMFNNGIMTYLLSGCLIFVYELKLLKYEVDKDV